MGTSDICGDHSFAKALLFNGIHTSIIKSKSRAYGNVCKHLAGVFFLYFLYRVLGVLVINHTACE